MEKPSQTHLYAGILIYRLQRNIEYLLLSDSFSNKKHWFCPKGQVIGSEDELKCAFREVFEATGLSPKQYRVEQKFKVQLKYLAGTRPKKVIYFLAQLLDNHARLLPNAEGVHFHWCTEQVAVEKVLFKSMQSVFSHTQKFVEMTQQTRRRQYDSHGHAVRNGSSDGEHRHKQYDQQHTNGSIFRNVDHTPSSLNQPHSGFNSPSAVMPVHPRINLPKQQQSSQQQQPQQQQISHPYATSNRSHSHENNNPLYKTRLCERFKLEGSCPYGPKCTFAHGIGELRERVQPVGDTEERENRGLSFAAGSNTSLLRNSAESNPLYKTKLCERFMVDQFCQYGPKCHFAHGEAELRQKPQSLYPLDREQEDQNGSYRSSPRPGHRQQEKDKERNDGVVKDRQFLRERSGRWRRDDDGNTRRERADSATLSDHSTEDQFVHRRAQPMETTRSPPDVTPAPMYGNGSAIDTTTDRFSNLDLKPLSSPTPKRTPNNVVAPAPVKQEIHETIPAAHILNTREEIVATDKSWMKIVHISKEEQAKFTPPVSRSPASPPSRSGQEEAIIKDLKQFFKQHPNTEMIKNGKLSDDVKEVTKIEMRNDLSKPQLLYILLVSLLEDVGKDGSQSCSIKSIITNRNHLFKTFVKTPADQKTLLKAWERLVKHANETLLAKTSIVLSLWYEYDLVDEDVCMAWYERLEENSDIKRRSSKFIEWLNTAEEEDDNE